MPDIDTSHIMIISSQLTEIRGWMKDTSCKIGRFQKKFWENRGKGFSASSEKLVYIILIQTSHEVTAIAGITLLCGRKQLARRPRPCLAGSNNCCLWHPSAARMRGFFDLLVNTTETWSKLAKNWSDPSPFLVTLRRGLNIHDCPLSINDFPPNG